MPTLHDPEFDPAVLPPELEQAIRRELAGDEKVAWIGRPRPGSLASAELATFAFGLPFTAFSIFWIAGVAQAPKGGAIVALFGLPFLGVGLFILSAPLRAWNRARGTCYLLTDRRAIVREPEFTPAGRSFRIESFGPDTIGTMYRSERRDGSGDLVFREVLEPFGRSGRRTRPRRRGFLAIHDVVAVERLVRSVLKGG